MKCPECKGYGCEGYSVEECVLCHGKRYVGPLTNDEWRQSCSAEEFAEWLLEHMDCIGCPANQEKCQRQYGACKKVIMEWLQQPHTIKETR